MGGVGYAEKMWALGLGGFLSLAAALRMEKRKLPVSPTSAPTSSSHPMVCLCLRVQQGLWVGLVCGWKTWFKKK